MRHHTSHAAALALLSAAALGCRHGDRVRADSATGASSARPGSTTAPSPTQPASPWTVTDSGAGVLRIGMTRDGLARELHSMPAGGASAGSDCSYLDIDGMPAGMRTMWVTGTLARIEITAPGVRTDRGAGVGDDRMRIDSLYGGRTTTMPAKYDPHGSYIVVRPASATDSSRRIVFETDSTHRVTRYRAGREPEVEWVEGCG